MILTSLDLESKKVTMLSIPRDLYVDYDPKYKSSRINEIVRDMSLRMEAM
jgi:anionic cell wall polymer biosynthesis LytR-Cps2A-Psr (LCP) family protein